MRRATLYLAAIAAAAALYHVAGWRLTLLLALIALVLVTIGALCALILADEAIHEPGDDRPYGDEPFLSDEVRAALNPDMDGLHHGAGLYPGQRKRASGKDGLFTGPLS